MMNWQGWVGHAVLGLISLATLITLHRNGIKFDVRVWRNGKKPEDK